uniref:Phosphatidylinositol glycan anchor biosynthesis class U protein n=1 Tax=Plectus sambesii TaxID=2011161 RepID=A0A914XA90_9BILA
MKRQRSEVKRIEKTEKTDGNEPLFVRSMDVASAAVVVQVCYLFNPFGIASCIAMTTSVFHNFLIAAALVAFQSGRPYVSASVLALVSMLGLYPAVLMVPIALHYATAGGNSKTPFDWTAFCSSIAVFCSVWAGALYMIVTLSGSWQFLQSTYLFFVLVPDLTPTVGVFWYFFTEVFDHFRLFFLWVFQLNIFIFVIPLALTLRRSPMMLFHILLILIAVFKPYPSVGDAVVYMALLPIWRHLYLYIRHSFLAACTMAVFAVLAPVMWKLWIQDGSANANFYFAITLAYCTAQIFLLTDLLYAELRHRIHMTHGIRVIDESGTEAKIALS